MSRPITVAVVGRRRDPPARDLALAEEVGCSIAHAGWVTVTGGRGGIMDAAQRGAHDAGGIVVAITPMDMEAVGPATVVIRSGLPAVARNIVTASSCDAMVVVPGSHGTWQETTIALERRIPVVAVGDHPVLFPGVEEVLSWQLSAVLQARLAPHSSTV